MRFAYFTLCMYCVHFLGSKWILYRKINSTLRHKPNIYQLICFLEIEELQHSESIGINDRFYCRFDNSKRGFVMKPMESLKPNYTTIKYRVTRYYWLCAIQFLFLLLISKLLAVPVHFIVLPEWYATKDIFCYVISLKVNFCDINFPCVCLNYS